MPFTIWIVIDLLLRTLNLPAIYIYIYIVLLQPKFYEYSYSSYIWFTDVLSRQSAKHGRHGRRGTAHKITTDKRSGLLSFDHLERPPSTSPLGNNVSQD